MEYVYIEHRKVKYPSHKYNYAPSTAYPEYKWKDLSPKKNIVYDMVRQSLFGYGLDQDNYGNKNWNPFGEIIKKGDNVVIKPNWVMDKNGNKWGGVKLSNNTRICNKSSNRLCIYSIRRYREYYCW